ncbi:MAG TPA: CidA/LrgA family protein [Clostridiaceae bacterium]|nr:CidA/LrgA family protein [Clostridiaceae bacterium]
MKILKAFTLILAVFFIGEVIKVMFGLPIPGNIIGFILLLLLLLWKVVRPESVESVTDFLLGNLTFFFIPSGVGLMSTFGLIQASLLKLTIIILVSTVVTMGTTGIVTQFVVRLRERRGN